MNKEVSKSKSMRPAPCPILYASRDSRPGILPPRLSTPYGRDGLAHSRSLVSTDRSTHGARRTARYFACFVKQSEHNNNNNNMQYIIICTQYAPRISIRISYVSRLLFFLCLRVALVLALALDDDIPLTLTLDYYAHLRTMHNAGRRRRGK